VNEFEPTDPAGLNKDIAILQNNEKKLTFEDERGIKPAFLVNKNPFNFMGDKDLDKHLLDNFKYGGPGSHSNNNLTVSPKRLRTTQLKGFVSLQDKETFSSQKVLPKFGGESKRADSPPYQERDLRRYQSLHTIKKTQNETYTNKQLMVRPEDAFRLKQKNPLKSAANLK
tara:strand:+ start:2241 stop:2750 length:510 start_codon:yes stop_codon:yes gene_type:complete